MVIKSAIVLSNVERVAIHVDGAEYELVVMMKSGREIVSRYGDNVELAVKHYEDILKNIGPYMENNQP